MTETNQTMLNPLIHLTHTNFWPSNHKPNCKRKRQAARAIEQPVSIVIALLVIQSLSATQPTQALPRQTHTYDPIHQNNKNIPQRLNDAKPHQQHHPTPSALAQKSRLSLFGSQTFAADASGIIDKLYSYDSKDGITTTTISSSSASMMPTSSTTAATTTAMSLDANHCPNGLLTFELSTGYIYRPSSPIETLTMMPSTLQLTDCLDYCLHNSSCLAINFEVGLCVLLTTSAKYNPQNLYSSQFPVFTIYAEKKCLHSSGK